MNCNITRSQKARANERQKNILSAITEYSKEEHQYGEYYMATSKNSFLSIQLSF